MKKQLMTGAVITAAVLVSATSAYAKTTTDYENIDSPKVALIGSASGGNFWGNIETGFNTEIEERGWAGDYLAPADPSTGDAGVLDLCETALIQGYNVIVPVMNDVSVFEDFLNRAKDSGILVIAYNSDPGEDYVPALVGIDSYASGQQQGEKIADFANEKGLEELNFVTMFSNKSISTQHDTEQGVMDALEANFNGTFNKVGEGESKDNASTAQDALSALFIANSDIDAIVCIDQMSAVGAAAYIEENGRQGDIIACGLSLDADGLLRVKSGALSATASVDSVYMGGKQLCGVIEAITTGAEFEYKNYPPKIWVLQDEVDTYAAEHDIDLG